MMKTVIFLSFIPSMVVFSFNALMHKPTMGPFVPSNCLSFGNKITRAHPNQASSFKLSSSSQDLPSNALVSEDQITSRKIEKYQKDIKELEDSLVSLQAQRQKDEEILAQLESEFGNEIARIKREFARIKERANEESSALSLQAKVDAVKEILPVTDDFFRAKKLYESLTTENEKKIVASYEEVFTSLARILEDFGATRVVSVGQPFDYTYMEAIMTAPSTEYGPDIVTTEYQVGYRMGDKCIRPALVVVSTGPGS